jgi:molybdopterin converting factor small subunit
VNVKIRIPLRLRQFTNGAGLLDAEGIQVKDSDEISIVPTSAGG